MIKAVGENTRILSQLQESQKIKVWGPCGSKQPESFYDHDEFWLVGGGIGIAPLLFFQHGIDARKKKVQVFYGNRTAEEVIKELKFRGSPPIWIATDDGSKCYHGKVTDLFLEEIEKQKNKNMAVITCGPNPMMREVNEICTINHIDCYVILEKIMACGIGVCLGCSVKMTTGMKCICKDGPVFNAKEVIWDELS